MSNKPGHLVTVSAFALGSAFVSAPGAIAQPSGSNANQTSEIIITAQRRSEKSVDVPITVSTLGSTQLARAGVATLSDISKLTPALRFDSSGVYVQPTIRGVGTAITTSGGGPNVGIYVDGFFQSNPAVADFQLLNVSSIQVLKGPQGTLFGRNTTGGAILVTTDDPSTTPGGQLKVSYGSYNARTVQGYATTGIGDKVAVDVEALYRAGDGFQHNFVTGNRRPGAYDNWSARIGLKAELTDRVTLLLRYQHSDTNDPTYNLANTFVDSSGAAGFFTMVSPAGKAFYQSNYGVSNSAGLPLVNLNFPGSSIATAPNDLSSNLRNLSFHNRSDIVQGTLKADLGFANLTSYTQYRKDVAISLEDLDGTGVASFDAILPAHDETISQEFLLNSKPGSALQWTTGVNYFRNKDDWNGFSASFGGAPFIPFGGSTTTTQSVAVFGDATYEVLPSAFFVTIGARYSHDQVIDAYFRTDPTTQFTGYEGANGQNVPLPPGTPLETAIPVPDLTNDSFTPRLVLRYKPTDKSSLYASYSRGFKAGILNVGGDSLKPVKPETNDAYEVGYKFSGRRFSFDVASYYYSYKDLQVSSFEAGEAKIRNAASAEIYGLEGQVRYRVDSHLDFTAGAAWTHARYVSFKNAPYYSFCDPTVAAPTPPATNPMFCSSGAGSIAETTTNASGFHMQRAPDYTANLGANYKFDVLSGEATLSGNLYYTSKFYFDPSQQFAQNSYTLLGLHAQWVDPSRHYTVAVFGDNVTNERYRIQVLANTLGISSVWSAPATWGVSVAAKF